jgi:hypothetical protein
MDVWDYDRKTGVLLGRSAADPNPEEPGAWLIPAYATTIRPPPVPEGCVAIFNGGLSAEGEWRIELLELGGVVLKACAAVSASIKSYIEDREDHDKVRSEITRLADDVIDQVAEGDKAVQDEAKSLVRALINGKSVN